MPGRFLRLTIPCIFFTLSLWLALGVSQALAVPPTLAEVLEQEDADAAETPVPETGDAEAKGGSAVAQSSTPPPRPHDPLGRGTPRSAVKGFIDAARAGDYETAAKYFDLRHLPRGLDRKRGPEYARKLKVVLDRKLWIDLAQLSADPKGHQDDRLPRLRDWVGMIELAGKPVDILLQGALGESGETIWKFSHTTVARIPDLYAAYGYGETGEWLSTRLPDIELLGLVLWQWVMLLGLALIAFAIAFVPTWLVAAILRRRQAVRGIELAGLVTGPIRLLIIVLIVSAWFDIIHPSVTARAIAEGHLLRIIAIAWGLLRGVDIFRRQFTQRLEARGAAETGVLLRPAATILKFVIIVAAVLVYLENLGFKATTLIAGLGIGGIAVALAAQKSVENLIGAITLVASAPVKVGDFCRFGDKLGVVEEFGLRWTRIRTLDRTLLHVPNASFADMQLENFAFRDKVLFNPQIRLRYDTSRDQLQRILAAVRTLLANHPKVDPDPARIRFSRFGAHALELDIFAYIITTDYNEYLEIAEDLHMRIMDIVTDAGAALAVPTQTIWVEQSPPANSVLVDTAAEKAQS